MIKYTDAELLELLEQNGFESSYTNLVILKENLEKGLIVIEEEKKEEPKKEEKVAVEEPAEVEVSGTTVSVSAAGDVSVVKDNKEIVADAQGNLTLSLAEHLSSKNTEIVLKSYLTEDCNMPNSEYEILKEETKVESVKTIAIDLLRSIEDKLNSVDTSIADKSRGDVKQLRELNIIQDCITKFEALIEREQSAMPEYSQAVKTIIKALLNINTYSAAFKDAYRNKKTLLILKYESLIFAILSSLSYLIANILSFDNGTVHLKPTTEDVLGFTGIKTLADFNRSVEAGEFKIVTKDVNTLREFYLEVPVEQMSSILEGYEYLPMIVSSIQNIYKQVVGENGNRITNILYKVAGVVVLIFSLREVFYTLFRMKTKASDMISSIQNFAGLNDGSGVLSKLTSFANKFKADATFSSDLAKREIEDENQKILGQVRDINSRPVPVKSDDAPEVVKATPVDDDFNFDF